jgi:hypothetical protein
MAFQKAIRSNVFEHKDDDNNVIALSVEFKVWDSVINPFEDGDGNNNCRLLEIYVSPEEYTNIISTGTAAEQKQELRRITKSKLKDKFETATKRHRVPVIKSVSASNALFGSDTIGDLG